ncbi:MAG: PIG-L family deacetylase [Chloroflexi bacterium]|nr:MAG: PIG-L family deacetylase [Phototrophicales bacterium]RMF77156.1 MAG: PIG-L family deacetylase [Chloroflexota bacterium]
MQAEAKIPARVLVIVAHADDIEFGMGGSIAYWTDSGAEVTYCIVTDNGSGSNEPGIVRADLVKIRQEEQCAAAAVLGVRDVRFLGYADGTLQPTLELRRDLTRLIREIRPDRVITLDPTTIFVQSPRGDYINHPDHRAAGEAASYAFFPSAETRPIFPELLDDGLEPHKAAELYMSITMQPNTYIDITDYMERKLEALRHHKSQIRDESLDFVRGWSSATGEEVGVQYAEVFRVMRFERE